MPYRRGTDGGSESAAGIEQDDNHERPRRDTPPPVKEDTEP